jgi:dienelactone hydrolase
MNFTSSTTEMGVTERGFDIEVAGERVPGIIWTPEGATGPRPLLLVGHGGTQHKRVEGVLARGRHMARQFGYAVVSLDAPDHGDRTTPERQAAARANIEERMRNRVQVRAEGEMSQMRERARKHVGEWKATLDAVQKLPEVGDGPVGWWGVSMGTSNGVPFIASEPRIKAAVLGLNGLREGQDEFRKQAESISIPLLFVFQWHDQLVSREAGLALFDAFAAREKTMHINPGGHTGIPAFERDAYDAFYLRHLGRSDSSIK